MMIDLNVVEVVEDTVLVSSMLRCVPVRDTAKLELLRLMSGADRHYHGINHLAALWRRHKALSPGTGMDAPALQPMVAAAIGWHDAIYIAGQQGNEQASAELWQQAATGGGLDPAAVEWVAATIAATADHIAPRMCGCPAISREVQWLLDLDLSPLGDAPEEFARKTAQLKIESAAANAEDWAKWRIEFFRRLVACPRIYLSPAIAAAYETQARANVEHELARLDVTDRKRAKGPGNTNRLVPPSEGTVSPHRHPGRAKPRRH
jgi:predicted metal-dependent HD superfamily phosphohydrolase